MFIVLTILALFILTGVLLIARRSRPSFSLRSERLIPPPENFTGLFNQSISRADEVTDKKNLLAVERLALLERARQFDLLALDDAHTISATRKAEGLYEEIVEVLLAQAGEGQKRFLAIVGHISKSKHLRASRGLANCMIEFWEQIPDRKPTTQLLHICALADDARLYQKSIESVVACWESGRLPEITAPDLLALIESEYWVIASAARRSGAGFALKASLSDIRHRLNGKD